jgi:dTDP-L-rhamnose 4-epimerase
MDGIESSQRNGKSKQRNGKSKRVLVTGGAGFIGSHLVDELLAHGYRVRVLDNLSPQVHGPGATRPAYLDAGAELIVADVRDRRAVEGALADIDAVVHLAAAVGVGQSMYEIREYMDVNAVGTAVLLEALAKRPIERLVVASSMSVYGEGSYVDGAGAEIEDAERTLEELRQGRWDPVDSAGAPLVPVPTRETKPPMLSSVYALSKYDQERLCLMVGRAYGIPTVALRLFNTYGPRQALSNPYTGVLAIFASRLLNGRRPAVFEDGEQRRDFVNVHDVARAFRLALTSPKAPSNVINVASGKSVTVNEIALGLAETLAVSRLTPEITHQYRVGDIRHCFADIGRARELLGFEPQVELGAGMLELARWLPSAQADDRTDLAQRELERHGLAI